MNKLLLMSLVIINLIANITTSHAADKSSCNGRFVDPINDIGWSNLFPITLGSNALISKGKRDIPNPANPVCVCMRGVDGVKLPIPGLAIGFWEPVGLIDVTRTPFCLVNMGGMKLASNGASRNHGTNNRTPDVESSSQYSFYNVHTYKYPLIYWLEIITDLGCLETSSFDLGYLSEFDPTWNDSSLSSILNPEVFLFSSIPAVLACVADCAMATASRPIDKMPWCAGCLGGLYPIAGKVAGHNGGIQASQLLAMRAIAKEHRVGMALETSTDTGEWFDGPLCKKYYAPFIKKSQYKLQLTYPVAMTKGTFSAVPLGMNVMLYNSLKEYPFGGEDFGYLLWRKKNCCFL